MHVDGVRPDVDGPSLGLGAAVALIALWQGASVPPNLAFSAAIRSGNLASVGFLEKKRNAFADVKLVVWEHQPGTTQDDQTVKDLRAAANAAGLSCSPVVPDFGSVVSVIDEVNRLTSAVEHQSLGPYGGAGIPAWEALAERLAAFVSILPDQPHLRVTRQRGMVAVTLAFSHAARMDRAKPFLTQFKGSNHPVAQAFDDLFQVMDAIDKGNPASDDALARLESRESLDELQAPLFVGYAIGTRGRALMHRGDSAQALPVLLQSVDWHRRNAPHEAARSLIYVAMAYRMLGNNDEAQNALDSSRADRTQFTKPYSPDLARITVVYENYERARLLLAKDELEGAAVLCTAALSQCEQLGLGPWPQIGLRRTLAWADRADAPRQVELIRSVCEKMPGDKVFEAILDEARGPYITGGEAY